MRLKVNCDAKNKGFVEKGSKHRRIRDSVFDELFNQSNFDEV